MQTREAPNKELKFLAFNEVFDAFSDGDAEKASYVLERSIFSEDEKQVIFNLIKDCKKVEVKKNGRKDSIED